MSGARRQRKKQSRAARFLFLVLLLNLAAAAALPRGDRREPVVHAFGEGSPPPPAHGQEEQLSRLLGSRPPCCERKCAGCAPCTPVQVRAGAAVGRRLRRPECANYEPVGWKCKCGAAVFDP